MSDVTVQRSAVTVTLTVPGAPPSVTLGSPTSEVTIKRDGLPGPPLANYEYTQSSPSATWVVNHNLGRRPAAVSVRSPGGREVVADVLHVSDSQVQINFAAPATGSAFLQ